MSNDTELEALRRYLDANNGIKGLRIFRPEEVDHVLTAFRRDGFVVVGEVLNDEQVEILAAGCQEVVDRKSVV